jgi:hypothetical protein
MAQSVRFTYDQRDHIIEKTLDATMKESPLFSKLVENGRVKTKVSANKMRRDYATQLVTVRTIGKGQQLDGMRAEQAPGYQRATYEQSGYWVNDIFDGIEVYQSKGPQKVRPMTTSAMNRLKRQLKTILMEETIKGDQTTSGNNIATGGGGLRFLGVLNVLNSTPTSGTLYGISRAACLSMQHQYIAGTAGVNGNVVTDIWDLLNHATAQTAWEWEEGHKEVDLIVFSRSNWRIFQNKTQMQNQNVATSDPGKRSKTYDGKEWDWDDFINADDVLGLNTSTWDYWTPRERLIEHRVIEGHPNYPIGTEVHDYEVHGSLLCASPRNNFRLHTVSI